MTYVGGEYSQQALLRELKQKITEENIQSFDQYEDIVDNLIEEKKSYGFFSEEEDLMQLRHNLEHAWYEMNLQK